MMIEGIFCCILGALSTTTRVLSVWLCVAFTIDRWISSFEERQSNLFQLNF